jgi:hypothetical protein
MNAVSAVQMRTQGDRPVTDNNTWHSPAGENTPPPAPQYPPPGGYAPPQAFPPPLFAPGYTTAPQGPVGQPVWTPPPKPGLIPLRPLGFGTLLGAAFQVMRRNPKPTVGMALLLNGGIGLLVAVVAGGIAFYAFGRVQGASSDDTDEIIAGSVGTGLILMIVPVLLSLVVSALLQGIVSLEVARATIGEKLTFRGLWRLAKGRVGVLIGWSALLSLVLLVAVVLFALAITLAISAGTPESILGAFGLAIIVGIAGFVVAAWIGIKLSLVPSILMLERVTLRTAIARSWSLTNGYFWKTLGITFLVNFIINVATQIISTPLSIVAGIGGSLINVNGEEQTGIVIAAVSYLISGVVSILVGAVAIVLLSAVTTLIYIDIRMRKEGLDIELARFVEARQTGETGVGNPYEYAHPPLPFAQPAAGPVPPTNASPWA